MTETVPAWELQCPDCQLRFTSSTSIKTPHHCGFETEAPWIALTKIEDPVNLHTEKAYQTYSKYYAVASLLAYWIVWRGRLRRHIAFFRGLLQKSTDIVDVATGEGSLTDLALFRGAKKARSVLAIDISRKMLQRAAVRFRKKPVQLILADVQRLPFASQSLSAVSCFGGLNSFPSLPTALAELRRVLKPDGVLRGSFLLFPQSPWRQRLVRDWIAKGYQTVSLPESEFRAQVEASGFRFKHTERINDVFLFELAP